MQTAIEAFRAERLDAPRDLYLQFAGAASVVLAEVIPKLPDVLGGAEDIEVLADIIGDADQRKCLLYTAAPPISEDDLKTIADTTLSRGRMLGDADAARRVIDVLRQILDPDRFPWVEEGREPAAPEFERAIDITSALIATQKVQTLRRNEGKDAQEQAVKDLMTARGFQEVPRREIRSLSQAPAPGTFMGETNVCGHRADVVVRLPDGRLCLIECKVSNSEVNSFKRIVNDTGGKSPIWYQQLGAANTIVAAVLSGVFSVDNLEFVQAHKGVSLFWAHRLDDLGAVVGQIGP